jgi:lipoate-protein ligase A
MVQPPFSIGARPSAAALAGLGWTLKRCLSAQAAAAAGIGGNKTQVFISRSQDPWVNLSVEHFLLQTTPPWATILFLYVNRPCVVFGRNQNPWSEVNLARLARIQQSPGDAQWNDLPVDLVRRRSGGGTVFHDKGNANFSVICPREAFNRDKHAEMVVRALKSLGRDTAHVNKRHDIVVKVPAEQGTKIFKVSGSAYKLTRLRALHHGTCLLDSPNLSSISGMLRSPAEGFVKAQGVDSVRSPVTNLGLQYDDFEAAVLEEFRGMYGSFDLHEEVDKQALHSDQIYDGYAELKSRDWIWGQTPRFTFSTHPHENDSRERPDLPFEVRQESSPSGPC